MIEPWTAFFCVIVAVAIIAIWSVWVAWMEGLLWSVDYSLREIYIPAIWRSLYYWHIGDWHERGHEGYRMDQG